jgi:P-type Cu+ transporter
MLSWLACFRGSTPIPAPALRWFLLALTAAVVAWAGRGIYVSAYQRTAARHNEHEHAGEPGNGRGVCLFRVCDDRAGAGAGSVYFDAVLLIVGFLLLGKALEARAKRRALAALDSLSRCGRRRRGAWWMACKRWCRSKRCGRATVSWCCPGSAFPVDATIVEGRTTVDESMLTGEATPLAREVGGRVLAGSLNYDGAVVCRAESLGEETVLAQIARMVDQAQSSRAPMERLADRRARFLCRWCWGWRR